MDLRGRRASDESSEPRIIALPEHAGEHFRNDLVALGDQLEAAGPIPIESAAAVGDGVKLLTNATADQLSSSAVLSGALREHGLGVHFTDGAVDMYKNPIKGSMRVVVEEPDLKAVRAVQRKTWPDHVARTPVEGAAGLVRAIDRGYIAEQATLANPVAAEVWHYEVGPIGDFALFQRGFLTALTLRANRRLGTEQTEGVNDPLGFKQDFALYERLREDGLTPLSVTEVHDIGRQVVQNVISGTPEVPITLQP